MNEKSLNSGKTTPLYCKIQNYILDLIKTNKLSEGDAIPTEMELSKMFGISRPTVRQGLNTLVSEGYLKRIKGKGTFITKPKIIQENTRFIESYNKEMCKKGLIPKTKVLEISIMITPEEVREMLNIGVEEKVIKIKRLRYAYGENEKNKKPTLLTTVYIPYKYVPSLITYDFEKRSLYEVLEENNIYIKKVIREIEARIVSKDESKLLNIKEGSPIQLLSSTGYLSDGTPIEYSQSIYPAERNKFIVEIIR